MTTNNIESLFLIIQILNITVCLISIVIGFKYLKFSKLNKLLLLLPVLSLLQIFSTELILAFRKYLEKSNEITQIIVLIYTILEFIIITTFIYFTELNRKYRKIILIISIFVLLIPGFEISFTSKNKNAISLDYFNLCEGIFFISLLSINLITQLKKSSFFEMFSNSIWISKSGILLAFLVFWPNSVIQNILIRNLKFFYKYLFISNSIGYLILYIFLSFSFYASRKSRIN